MKGIRLIPFIFVVSFSLSCGLGCDSPFDSGQNDGEVKVVWSYPREQVYVFADVINPIIENGRVYAASGASLVCTELKSGKEIWRVGLGNGRSIGSRRLLHSGDRIFFSHDWFVKAFDKQTGKVIWHTVVNNFQAHDLAGMSQNTTHLFLEGHDAVVRLHKESGAVDLRIAMDALKPEGVRQTAWLTAVSEDGLLYIPTAFYVPEVLPAPQGNIFCYDADSGEYVWGWHAPNRKVLLPGNPDSTWISADLQDCAISDKFVATFSGQSVWLLDRFTGKLLWERFFQDAGFASVGVTIAEGKVFVGSTRGRIIAIDLASSEVVWTVETKYTVANLFTYDNGRLYFCNNSGSGIWVIDVATGAVLWNGQPPERQNDRFANFFSPVAVGEGHMVNIGAKKVYCLTLP